MSVFSNVAIAQQMLLSLVDKPTKEVPLVMFKNPIWTTWARYKRGIDQQKVLTFAKEIVDHQFPFSVLEIDDKWCSGIHQSMMSTLKDLRSLIFEILFKNSCILTQMFFSS